MSRTKHTDTPWLVELDNPCANPPGHTIKQNDDVRRPIASLWEGGGTKGKKIQKANAKFIVQACNSHDDLVETLKRCIVDANLNLSAESRRKRIKFAVAALKRAGVKL